MGNKPKYPLERKAEQFLDAARKYFFVPPKDKMDRMAHTFEIISWLLFTIALLLRVR